MVLDSHVPENADTETQNTKKRSAVEMDEENEEDLVDQLLPAAAAMKRRRIEEEEEAARTGKSTQRSFGHIQERAEVEKPRKPKKEVNIKEVVRERREAEEETARREEEDLRETMDGIDVEGMKNLAVVEEMDLPARTSRPQRNQTNGTSNRWNERWNGRKNFKKFRRQGEGTPARRGQSVIVPLEEVKKKDFGIGESYWLESPKMKKKRKASERASQSQSQPFATAREEEVEDLGGEDTPGAADVETAEQSTNRSQLANGKRPAPDRGSGGAVKRQKIFAVKESDSESESESEDELKFRFKKRR